MMNFLEAVKAMKEGKKVRQPYWKTIVNKYIHFDIESPDCMIYGSNNRAYSLTLIDLDATDWEIYEEKKTLSDRIESNPWLGSSIRVEHIKESLKEFFDRMKPDGSSIPRNLKLAREIFGDELISKV